MLAYCFVTEEFRCEIKDEIRSQPQNRTRSQNSYNKAKRKAKIESNSVKTRGYRLATLQRRTLPYLTDSLRQRQRAIIVEFAVAISATGSFSRGVAFTPNENTLTALEDLEIAECTCRPKTDEQLTAEILYPSQDNMSPTPTAHNSQSVSSILSFSYWCRYAMKLNEMDMIDMRISLARELVCGWRLTRRFNTPLCFWRRHRHRQGSLDGTVNSASACTGHVAYIACAVVWYDWCPSHAAMTQPCPALDVVNYAAIDVSTLCLCMCDVPQKQADRQCVLWRMNRHFRNKHASDKCRRHGALLTKLPHSSLESSSTNVEPW
ncbi:hypothetical protein CBL_13402 [Carabus blaptoides fortunei]